MAFQAKQATGLDPVVATGSREESTSIKRT
jgi:hypothetical protein